MSKSSLALSTLPPEAQTSLTALGEHLALARLRRNESQRTWASRIGVSVPTLIRLERGDPGVSMGVYVTALWLLGLAGRLGELASPPHDLRAVEFSVRAATRKRAARQQVSLAAQLGKQTAQTVPPPAAHPDPLSAPPAARPRATRKRSAP